MRTRAWCVHPRTVQVQVQILEEMERVPLNLGKCKKLRNTLKLRFQEERRQRDSQAKKRYNCYKNIVKLLKYNIIIFRKCDSDVPKVIMKRRQQDAQEKAAKHCSTENTARSSAKCHRWNSTAIKGMSEQSSGPFSPPLSSL